MTIEEAKRHLLDTVDCGGCGYTDECNDCIVTATLMAIKALEKLEKYKWHDLRKNPNDLPNVETRVEIVLDLIRSKVNNFGTLVKYGKWAVNGFITPLDVIAWREIEPFEEVSE